VLSESSYLTALYAYIGAGIAMMLYLAFWLRKYWSAGTVTLLVLLAGALLLTPAYPREGVTTFAPALIVAGFQWATEGQEAAGHALRPLGAALAVACVVSLLLRLTLFRRAS
jgi:hypothetical protein